MTPEVPSYRRRPVSRVGEELPGSFEDQGLQRGSGLMRLVSPAGEVLLLVLPRRSTQEESAPTASPGCAGCSALLSRNGRAAHPKGASCGAELGATPLRQSSPFFPLRLALLDDAKGQMKTTPISTAIGIDSVRCVFPPPRAAPSNGGRPGAVGEHCLRGKAPSLCLPPGHPSSAGQPAKPAA